MKTPLLFFAVLFICLSLIAGHALSQQPAPSAPATPAAPEVKKEDASLSGKVVETMTGGGYTYALIEKNGKKTWVAVPATDIKVGQEITFRPGVDMGPFESRTLKRKFDDIIFSAGLAGEAPRAHGTGTAPDDTAAAEMIKVEKAQGPNAYTINELINNSEKLDKQKIVVRGKVIKVSESIMEKNWIHIKDNSGDPKQKLVVTSQDLPAVGDVVTVSGTLYKDKDFGSGYKYAVIIEEASVKK